jgi:integrase
MRSVSAPFSWAILKRKDLREQIGTHPLLGIEKKPTTPRDTYITSEQWQKVDENISGKLTDIIHLLKDTGARPIEARLIEAKHFKRDERIIYFEDPPKKMNGEKQPRTIYLTDRAFDIVQRLALKYPTGTLFRNHVSKAWTRNALRLRFKRLKETSGVSITAYSLRHTFCTDRLIAGVDPLSVAALMGHKDGKMVMRIYNQLNKAKDHLREALTKKKVS